MMTETEVRLMIAGVLADRTLHLGERKRVALALRFDDALRDVGVTTVHVVTPETDEPAAFYDQDDAEKFAATYGTPGATGVFRVTVCDRALAAKLIAARTDEPYCPWCTDGLDPEDPDELCGNVGCKFNPGTES